MPEKSGGTVHKLSPVNISRVAFGVRYEPQFGVLNHVGEVVDSILRTEGTPFDTEIFPQTTTDVAGYTLVNSERGIALQINQQDTILHWKHESRNLDDLVALSKGFQEYVISALKKHANIRSIVRHGFLIRLEPISGGSLKNPPIARYLSNDFPGSNLTSLAMRFTRRLPTLEAIAKKGVDDYRTVIYGVQEAEDGKVQLEVDYQEYFRPLLDSADWAKHPFDRFVTQGISFFEGEFSSWLKLLSGVPEVA